MTELFEASELWQRTLGPRDSDEFAEPRATLREAFLQFRRTVQPLAGEIAVSMPMFTDHSIAHVDALWDTASLILGPDYPINPAEAFVLGGAFLLHDLGMGLAAFPDGHASIHEDPLFADAKAALIASQGVKKDEAHDAATVQILRLRHARQAERLVSQQFNSNGTVFYLLQDADLRAVYGPLIGRIAHSHWFDVSELSTNFGVIIGAHPSLPPSWQIDPFKIACILRLADAAQIDSRRAPLYLHAFRRPSGVSQDHWLFQQRLLRPRRVEDRLEYSSTSAFLPDESASWWLAYDTIRMISDELRLVDAACADLGKNRFPTKSVAGADDPLRFSRYVQTEGWSPIDASLRVTKVGKIVENLGGAALYGKKPLLGLRELISNAADATRARKTQFGGTDLAIKVKLSREPDGWILSVRDRGLGMTGSQMVANLTDFGTSNWVSSSRLEEYPGLLSKGYKPTGRFGIGFYASFMLADRVEVRSLKYRGASNETSVLVFPDGAKARPLLRPATEDEQLDLGGTEVRLFLKAEPHSVHGLLGGSYHRFEEGAALAALLRPMCALMDVDLHLHGPQDSDARRVVRGDEWKTMEPSHLFDVLYGNELYSDLNKKFEVFREIFVQNVEDILDEDGDVIGRAALAISPMSGVVEVGPAHLPVASASVYVGGMSADRLRNILGAFAGEPLRADRNSAFPIAQPNRLREWAESQGQIVSNANGTKNSLFMANQIVLGLGGQVSSLVCGYVSTGAIKVSELEGWLSSRSEVIMIDDDSVWHFERPNGDIEFFDSNNGRFVSLPDNYIIVELYGHWLLPSEAMGEPVNDAFESRIDPDVETWDPAWWWYVSGFQTSPYQVLMAASAAWDCDAVELGMRLEEHKPGDANTSKVFLPYSDSDGGFHVPAFRLPRDPVQEQPKSGS